MTEIVKVQRPLRANDPWMMHDRGQKHAVLMPDDAVPKHVKDAMGDDDKAFFIGAWSSIVGWGLSVRAKGRHWW